MIAMCSAVIPAPILGPDLSTTFPTGLGISHQFINPSNNDGRFVLITLAALIRIVAIRLSLFKKAVASGIEENQRFLQYLVITI